MADLLRAVTLDGYQLRIFDTGRTDWRGQSYLAYTLHGPDEGDLIFEGDEFAGSPMHADDSNETVRALLGFLTLRLGDIDQDYFDEYTARQIQFRDTEAENLAMYALDDGPELMELSQ